LAFGGKMGMDKATRVTLMYARLMQGQKLSKDLCRHEYEISERTFDRDIDIVRMVLSELYSGKELIYNRKTKEYFIKNR
jgi:predicted DNA-binding transcriptional regulator YafY